MAQFEEVLGIVAGIGTATSLLPQLFKMMREKKASDISVLTLLILLTSLALWIWYGFLKDDLPIILTNIASLAINISIIIARGYYKKHPNNERI